VHLLDIIAQLPYFQDEKHTSFCLIFTFILPHGHFLLTFLLPLLDLVMMICLHLLLDLSSLLSRHLFAIGLADVCSCRSDVLAAVRSNPKGRDSMKKLCTTTRARHGDFNPPRTYDQKACMRIVAGHLSPKNKSRMVTTISMLNLPMLFAITCQRSQFGL
jgi:hypothetical protein